MPRKKSKGRGRGRGRGQENANTASNEPKRPGTNNAAGGRNDEEQKPPQQTQPIEQSTVQPHRENVPQGAHYDQAQASSKVLPREEENPPQVTIPDQKQREPPNRRNPGPDRPSGQGRPNHADSIPQGKGLPQGRGRGRGQENANTASNESKRPGTNNAARGRNDEEQNPPQQTQPIEQSTVQPHRENVPQGAHYDQAQASSKVLPGEEEKPPHVTIPDQKQREPPNRSNPGQDRPSGQGRPNGLPQGQTSASASTRPHSQRSGSQSVQVVASAMSVERPSHLKQQTEPLPPRPGFGNQGRPIRLKANFFKLDFSGVDYIFHYHIDIEPERTPISECREIVNHAVKKYRNYFDNHKPAFDGRKNLYCRHKLSKVNGTGCELEVKLPGKDGGKDRAFKLTIKYAAQVCIEDLHKFLAAGRGKMPQDAVQALDIVLRQIPSLHFTPVGRSFFPTNYRGENLGGGCEVRTGFYQSIRPSQWKTMLVNIDVSSKGFVKAQPVIDLLCEIGQLHESNLADRKWRMDRRMEKEFLEAIRGFKVETGHLETKRKYTVMELGKNAESHTFKLQDDDGTPIRTISVNNYFKEKYNRDLKYPHLPCLVVGQKKNYLPMEVCTMIASQKRKLTDAQTAEMIKKVTKPARERQRNVIEWAGQLENNSRQYLKEEYGMSINSNMVDVNGRVLPPPKVTLGNKDSIIPQNGVWDMRNKRFFAGRDLKTWAMVCFVDQRRYGQDVTRKFAQQMEYVCRNEGMQMSGQPCDIHYARTSANIEQILANLVLRYQDLQLILVVLDPRDNKEVYKEVKRVGDTVLGIPTQCVQAKQFYDAKPQVCSNIAMKINAKLGGTNHVVDPSAMPPVFENVIVFGADVTHPSPGESNIPSIAAVVASMDRYASRYAARVRAQTHMKDKSAQEIILDMAGMVKELLVEFYKQTKTKPKRIIFYRDGVSEGQFDQVLLHEVRAVQEACLNIQKDGQYQPPITFVVVQKRHHARLFCVDKKDESGRAGNVPPGTMVDSGITHPFEFDFYLCSHQGIQGTSRPTHYHVLYDDNNFDANSLHKLTYHLCHTYARCTRSVSMPSPAYYAHLVAFRARHHLNGMVSRQEKVDKDLLEKFSKAINVNDKMKGGMYFA